MISRDLRNIAHTLLLVAAVLGMIAAGLWFRGDALVPEALARPKRLTAENTGIPDSGRQRQLILAELKRLNSRLEAIESALREGAYVVQTKPAVGEAGATAGEAK